MRTEILRDPEAARLEAAGLVRKVGDVPYKLGLDGDPGKLFAEGYGNCVRKHLYIASKLEDFDYSVTDIGIALFDWRSFRIPPGVINKLKDPIDTHPFLYVQNLGGKEIIIDVAWDLGMPEGFPVSFWDGIRSTGLGVKPIEIRREKYSLFKARASFFMAVNQVRGRIGQTRATPFNDAFNDWIGRGEKSLFS